MHIVKKQLILKILKNTFFGECTEMSNNFLDKQLIGYLLENVNIKDNKNENIL